MKISVAQTNMSLVPLSDADKKAIEQAKKSKQGKDSIPANMM